MNIVIIIVLILFIIISLIILILNIKHFISDIFDKNVIIITKTINFLLKIYNNEISKETINTFKDVYEKCLYNGLIVVQDNSIKLTKDGVSICFQYTNNKYIMINIFFSIVILILTVYSILK